MPKLISLPKDSFKQQFIYRPKLHKQKIVRIEQGTNVLTNQTSLHIHFDDDTYSVLYFDLPHVPGNHILIGTITMNGQIQPLYVHEITLAEDKMFIDLEIIVGREKYEMHQIETDLLVSFLNVADIAEGINPDLAGDGLMAFHIPNGKQLESTHYNEYPFDGGNPVLKLTYTDKSVDYLRLDQAAKFIFHYNTIVDNVCRVETSKFKIDSGMVNFEYISEDGKVYNLELPASCIAEFKNVLAVNDFDVVAARRKHAEWHNEQMRDINMSDYEPERY